MENSTNYPIVIQALPRWDNSYTASIINLAKELSLQQPVFFIEHPYTWKDVMARKKEAPLCRRIAHWTQGKAFLECPFSEFPNFHNIAPTPVAPINFLPKGLLYESLRLKVNRQIWQQVDCILRAAQVSQFIYVNSFDPVFSLAPSSLEIVLTIYHCVDDISGEAYIAKHGVLAEQQAMQQADMVITTSKSLQKYAHQWNIQSYAVENAADFAHFSKPMPMPSDLNAIRGLKLLYVGNIGLRMDYALIEQVAKQHPQLQLIFIGPKNDREFQGDQLEKYSNIHFFGARNYSSLPAYMQHVDMCWIPFKCNALTSHIYPLKINEYLAAGKPVIATPFAHFGKLSQVTFICATAHEVATKLPVICKERNSTVKVETRQQLAQENTWQHRAQLWREISDRQLWKKSNNYRALVA